jgi:hypothetical protein
MCKLHELPGLKPMEGLSDRDKVGLGVGGQQTLLPGSNPQLNVLAVVFELGGLAAGLDHFGTDVGADGLLEVRGHPQQDLAGTSGDVQEGAFSA